MANECTAKATFVTFEAGEALTAKYLVIVDPSADRQVIHPTADNMFCIGINQDAKSSGESANIGLLTGGGTFTGIASGSITRGDKLICANGGKVKSDPATSSTTSNIIGIALESASDTEEILFIPLCYSVYNS